MSSSNSNDSRYSLSGTHSIRIDYRPIPAVDYIARSLTVRVELLPAGV
jgi:hypothetical protein